MSQIVVLLNDHSLDSMYLMIANIVTAMSKFQIYHSFGVDITVIHSWKSIAFSYPGIVRSNPAKATFIFL